MYKDRAPRVRAGDKPPRDEFKPRRNAKKPWEHRDHDSAAPRAPGFHKPFAPPRDARPPRRDDELFLASGRVADIVGPAPQSRFDMLRKLWDFFRDERLVVPAERSHANPDDWRGEREDRPRPFAKSRERHAEPYHHKPAGKHPTAKKRQQLEHVPRRKFKETRD